MECQVVFEIICVKFHKGSLKLSTWLKVKRLKCASSILLNGLIAQKVQYNFGSFHRNRSFFKTKRDICKRSAFLLMKSFRSALLDFISGIICCLSPLRHSIGANKQKISKGNCSQNNIGTKKQDDPIPLPDGKESAYNGFRISRRPAAARTTVGLLDGAWDNQNSTAGGKNCKSQFHILKPLFCSACRGFAKGKTVL